ncbi:D-allose transport system permease protein AlsC [Serratia marcescens]|uniref:ABC transporter permease n=1 Tax=Serratia TaxID=613 RepID=UPI0007451ED5|nr:MULTISPECIES: ABC transporter permease [Serratia]CUZ49921.1 D-allose transport system permease protein AlsC [Serratia marcescens]CVA07000.1 D-allose transport system permease protein AlsC [Serratia marcescens]CVA18266.1 D-allose transport system permease protein AlsC [Serratia marcescens]CVA19247.1 D-allose transport system permease protein AlsC [Serratia marcescens]CVA19988.1 D-allose transport system permease protein AlsC [Serratia marcescens]
MSKTSVKSTALEQRVSLAQDGAGPWLMQVLTRYGLLLLCIALVVLFSLLTPSFASMLTLQAILSSKAKIALLALAATIPMIVGKIDLNVGFGIVLWHILAITLQVEYGFSWQMAVLTVLAISALYGLLNGILVALADIDSFVATLGSGTVLYAIALWYSGGRQIVGDLPDAFIALHHTEIAGIPIVAFYVLIVAVVLWLITEHTPLGRCMYAVGGNPAAARLNGISVNRFTIGAFITSSVLTGFSGVLIAAEQGVGQASVGMDYLLPALVGAFLGSTTIRPGRVNVWGTVVGIAILAIGIAGIQQFGGEFWVEPLFNGATLLLSITLAGYAQRRRLLNQKAVQRSQATPADNNNQTATHP